MRCMASLPGYWSVPGGWWVTNAGLLKNKGLPASPPARQPASPTPYRSIARAA